jgi:hypothetical protein
MDKWYTSDKNYVAYLMSLGYSPCTLFYKERKGKYSKCFLYDYPKEFMEDLVSKYIDSPEGKFMRLVNELTTRINQTGTVRDADVDLLIWTQSAGEKIE